LGSGEKFNTTYFCDVIIAKLVQALYPRGTVPRRRKFSLHLDNARPHNSAEATEFIDGKKFIRLPHPPYSPDVALSHFCLFGMLKEKLKSCQARMFDELKEQVDAILRSIPETELISVFETWFRRLQQIIDSVGEYI
jgi:histone-lysine N-methyltransferase SETMAR